MPYCEGVSSQWHELCERNLGHAAVRPGHAGLPDDLVRSGAVVPSQDPSWWVVWCGATGSLAARQGGEGPWCDSETSVIRYLFHSYNLSVEG